LAKIPNDQGNMPEVFPTNINELIVAGNELLPNGQHNGWNKAKSINLLRFYGEEDQTDNEDEYSQSSRARRFRLARKRSRNSDLSCQTKSSGTKDRSYEIAA
jgi:hypothetical protein